MFCDTFSETSKIMKFSILAQNMIFSVGADMAQNQYILIKNIRVYHQEDPPLPTLFQNLKGGVFSRILKNKLRLIVIVNLNCPTLRLFVETISQGLISILYPTFATLDLKDVAKGICAKTSPKKAAPRKKGRSSSREAEAKEEKNWILSSRKTESLQF